MGVAEREGFEPRCYRTPLFESGTINHSDTSPCERIPKGPALRPRAAARRRVRPARAVGPARRSAGRSRGEELLEPRPAGCPLTTLRRRGRPACSASWTACRRLRRRGSGRRRRGLDVAARSAPTHIGARLHGAEDRHVAQRGRAEPAGGLAQRDDHRVGRRVAALADSVVAAGDHRLVERRRRRACGPLASATASRASARASPMNSS